VHLRVGDDNTLDARGEALARAGHPVIRIALRDSLDLGAEFFRWEFATATVGAFLNVDPFDQPNVQESKDNTNRILASGDPAAWPHAHAIAPGDEAALESFIRGARTGDYLALMAFIHQTDARDAIFGDIRATLCDATKAATTFGYGPRFLHSTGQLHKGGPNSGVFIQLVCESSEKLPIPGQPFDFATLVAAQALGDLQSLQAHGRRVLRVQLGADVDAALATLLRAVRKISGALSPAPR
jgi:glucose-6-phosphate isomerase/transaldolase/glucose-6-phosphate isomerase